MDVGEEDESQFRSIRRYDRSASQNTIRLLSTLQDGSQFVVQFYVIDKVENRRTTVVYSQEGEDKA